jgi:hypothetical protein
MARQASAKCLIAIQRFFANCKVNSPGKKGIRNLEFSWNLNQNFLGNLCAYELVPDWVFNLCLSDQTLTGVV